MANHSWLSNQCLEERSARKVPKLKMFATIARSEGIGQMSAEAEEDPEVEEEEAIPTVATRVQILTESDDIVAAEATLIGTTADPVISRRVDALSAVNAAISSATALKTSQDLPREGQDLTQKDEEGMRRGEEVPLLQVVETEESTEEAIAEEEEGALAHIARKALRGLSESCIT
mmetsp:Transcript_33686/g.24718  ORF Transcript_33686/g.24718 Transcript_33686/m.24718 type:complete len:175 (-) Transcript_33686:31-555(-)